MLCCTSWSLRAFLYQIIPPTPFYLWLCFSFTPNFRGCVPDLSNLPCFFLYQLSDFSCFLLVFKILIISHVCSAFKPVCFSHLKRSNKNKTRTKWSFMFLFLFSPSPPTLIGFSKRTGSVMVLKIRLVGPRRKDSPGPFEECFQVRIIFMMLPRHFTLHWHLCWWSKSNSGGGKTFIISYHKSRQFALSFFNCFLKIN